VSKKRRREDWGENKSLGNKANKAVRKAKFKKYEELYDRLETNEGEKEVYRLAKVRETVQGCSIGMVKDEGDRPQIYEIKRGR